jgi:ankyrin repeat protein
LSHSVLMVGSAQLGVAAKRGDTAEVRRLVRSGENVDGHGGGGPLHVAAVMGYTETAKALLELGATVDGLDPHATPLHTAAANGRAGDILMLPQQALLPIFTPRRS